MTEIRTLALESIIDFLGQCAPLRRVEYASLKRLAERVVLRRHDRATLLESPATPEYARSLRILFHGHVGVTAKRGRRNHKRWLGPRQMIGLDAIIAWARAAAGGAYDGPATPTWQHSARAEEAVWCLELHPSRFEELLAPAAQPNELLRALFDAVRVREHVHDVVTALRRTELFALARVQHLFELAEQGELVTLAADHEVPRGPVDSVVDGFFVLLEGQLSAPANERVERGEVRYLDELVNNKKSSVVYTATRPSAVLRFDAEDFTRFYSHCDELQRALHRKQGELALDVPARALVGTRVVVLVDQSARNLPLGIVSDRIAEGLAEHAPTRSVASFHVTAKPPQENDDSAGKLPDDGVARRSISAGALTLEAVVSWSSAGTVLLEESRDGNTGRVAPAIRAQLDALEVPYTVAYFMDDPEQWLEAPFTIEPTLHVTTQPVAIIDVDNARGLGVTLTDALDHVRHDPAPLADRVREAVSMVAPIAAADVRARLARLRRRVLLRDNDHKRFNPAFAAPTWPLDAVRVPFAVDEHDWGDSPATSLSAASSTTTTTGPSATLTAMLLWLSGKRVGVALGGAGALSYVGVPLLKNLDVAGVPVYAVSGTSFGTVVGAYYCANGSVSELELLIRRWPAIQFVLLFSWWTTAGIARLIDFDLGVRLLTSTAVTLVPVATEARSVSEYNIFGGYLGEGVRASGSLPPFAPTIIGPLRLLDGGITADVPAGVLHLTCDIVVAANPWPPAQMLPAPITFPPLLSHILRSQSLLLRFVDTARGFFELWRQAGDSQLKYADVDYNATTTFGLPPLFFQGARIAAEAESSSALQSAVAETAYLYNLP